MENGSVFGPGNRRDFLKKGAVAGGLLWVAPAVSKVAIAKAAPGSPTPVGCTCAANAFGLQVIIPSLAINQTFGVGGCLTGNITVGVPGLSVFASAICGDVTGCAATASIANLKVETSALSVHATVLRSAASASCTPCNTTGDSQIANLKINNAQVSIGTCNLSLLGLVVVDEQTCVGDTLSVNALHILVPGLIEVIAAHAGAGATGCPCTVC